MTTMTAAQLWQETQARARLPQAATRHDQEQPALAQLIASLDRPHGPLSGPALKRCLRTQSGWQVLRLVYANDTLGAGRAG